jgi:hypothetical protein
MSVRAFKVAISSLKLLTLPNINNLSKHLDAKNEGFISIGAFEAQVKSAYNPEQTMKNSTMGNTSSSAKWI